MQEQLTILIIDDEESIRNELAEYLQNNNFKVLMAEAASEALNLLNTYEIDVVFLDIRLPEINGIELLKIIKEEFPQTEIIMISGHGEMQSVIEAMRRGACDFLPKPFSLTEVSSAIERTRRFIDLNNRLKEVENSFNLFASNIKKELGQGFIAQSSSMKKVTELVNKVAKSDPTNVLITGESGTGKELVARAIHYMSPRKDHYFYAVNSSAITETLFESEFFGHNKGSFTGANENKTGWFEVANKGTLFLDEIGDLPLSLQTKFLRVLEERKISRVGGTREIDIDVRIIAATNQDLEKLTEEKQFRLDLYHRLSTFIIHIPPLRERKEDIPLLINYFVDDFSKKMNKKITRIDKEVIDTLMDYSFPGNVRELRNMVERAIILSDGGRLSANDFQIDKVSKKISHTNNNFEVLDLNVLERNAIIKAIHQANFNKSAAAKLLNISFQALDRRIKKYKLVFEKRLG